MRFLRGYFWTTLKGKEPMEIIYQKDRLNKKFEISDLAEDTKYNISIKTEFDGTEMDPACLLEVHTFTKLQAPINLSSKKIANDSFSLRYVDTCNTAPRRPSRYHEQCYRSTYDMISLIAL